MANFMSSSMLLFVVIIGMLLINCAGTPDTNPVQEVQNEYEEIKDDSLVVTKAPEALREAREAMADLRKSIGSGDSQASIEQRMMIARQRMEIAQKTAQLRAAQDEVRRTSKELRMLNNELRQAEQEGIRSGRINIAAEQRAKHLKNFRVRQTNRGLVLRFLTVNFDQEKAYLKSSAEPPINELADFLYAYPQRRVLIEGHTDNTGSSNFNKQLSRQRAEAVRDALISRDIAAWRIQAIGLGEQYPRTSNDTEAGRRYNRRVEVIVSDKSGKIPDRNGK